MGAGCECLNKTRQNDKDNIISCDTTSKEESYISEMNTMLTVTQKKNSGNNIKLRQQRNSAFLTRTTIHVGVYGYLQSGKKSLIKRIINDSFAIDEPITLSKMNIKLPFNGKSYEIIFILCPYSQSVARHIDFYLVLYDINNEESLQIAKQIINRDLMSKIHIYDDKDLKSNIFLIGNKCDDSSSNKKRSEEYCRKNSLHYYEMSIKNNINVKDVFDDIMTIFDIITHQK